MTTDPKRRPEKAPPEPEKSKTDISKQATLDPKLSDDSKTPGSGMTPGDDGGAPSG